VGKKEKHSIETKAIVERPEKALEDPEKTLGRILLVLLGEDLKVKVRAVAVFYTAVGGKHKGAIGSECFIGDAERELIENIPTVIKRMNNKEANAVWLDAVLKKMQDMVERR